MRSLLLSLSSLFLISVAACAVEPDLSETDSSGDAVLEEVAETSEALSACGTGLYCYATPHKGTGACLNNTSQVYCCPSGYAMAGGSCLPICGVGLSCGYNNVWPSGSNVCTQNNGNGNPVYCCASGKTFTSNGCM